MFIVTLEAEEKPEESLQEQTADSQVAMIVANPTNPIELSLTLGKEKAGVANV